MADQQYKTEGGSGACEHGHQERKCPHCELNFYYTETARLEAQLSELKEERDAWREREAELLAIIEGLQDVANGDVTKINMQDMRGSVAKIFDKFKP